MFYRDFNGDWQPMPLPRRFARSLKALAETLWDDWNRVGRVGRKDVSVTQIAHVQSALTARDMMSGSEIIPKNIKSGWTAKP